MNWTVHKIKGQSYIKVTTEGVFSSADHLKMIEDIVSRDFWMPGTNVLFDHRNLEFGETDVSIFKEASSNHEKNDQHIGDGKAAILMKSLADFGRGRQFELIADNKISAKLHIFLREKEAIKWLTSEKKSAAKTRKIF